MPTVRELSARYESFMLPPRRGPGVCDVCLTLTDGYSRCYACAYSESWLDAVAPISYSVAHEPLHLALAGYKRSATEAARWISTGLAAILWRYLIRHERCVAHAAGTRQFEIVTTVPSADRQRDLRHPLRRIVGALVKPTAVRYERSLVCSDLPVHPRAFDCHKFEVVRPLQGQAVLLIDDTWTTGANAQSAAAALKAAGAGRTALVVIGRHINRDWHENDRRLRALLGRFDWETCALCADKSLRDEQRSKVGLATRRDG